MSTRWFTPCTARKTLESLRPVAEGMCRIYRVMEVLRPRPVVPDRRVDPDYFSMVRDLLAALHKLREAGIQVKDPKLGLLDFPARRAGRMVLLCWKIGETGLDFWHETEAGFAGRQPVDEDGPWEEAEAPRQGGE